MPLAALFILRDLEVGIPPCREAPVQIGHIVSRSFEDARGEGRANSTGAVRHDLPIERKLVCARPEVLVRDMERARDMPLVPLGLFTHVEEDGAGVSSFGGRSSVELLDPPELEKRSPALRHSR